MGSSNNTSTIKQNLCFPMLKTNDVNQYTNPSGIPSPIPNVDSNADGNRFGINRNTNTNNDADTISTEEVDEKMKNVKGLDDFFKAFMEIKDKKPNYNTPNTSDERAELSQVYEDARNTTAAQEDLARNAAMKAAQNQGLSGAKASALAGSKTPIGNAEQNLSTARSNWIAQKNAEMERKAQADALARETANIEKGRDYNVLASALGGGATGAAIGAQIFGGSTGGGKQ